VVIRVNGETKDTDATTVAAILESLGIVGPQKGTAVALNRAVVPHGKWGDTELHEGDAVEIIRAAQGG